MELVVLGAGTPQPCGERFGTSFLLDVDGEKLLFDCGPAATQKLAKAGTDPGEIHHLVFTHHHFDHDADYATFVLSRWDQGADLLPELRVYGPWPTKEVTEALFGENGAFRFDINSRMNHPSSQKLHLTRGGTLPRRSPAIDVRVLEPGACFDGDRWSISAARAQHNQPYLDSLAYRLTTSQGSLVICGDAVPDDDLVSFARGADTIVITCSDEQDVLEKLLEGRGIAAGITGIAGTKSVAKFAQAAGARRLVLTHCSTNIGKEPGRSRALAQVADIFDGRIVLSDEMQRIDLGRE